MYVCNCIIYERDKENVNGQGQGHQKVKKSFLTIYLEQLTASRYGFFIVFPLKNHLYGVYGDVHLRLWPTMKSYDVNKQ